MKLIKSFLKYILFWLVLFTTQRLLFFTYHYKQISEASISDQCWLFIKGIRLDLSMSGYFLLVPILLLIIQWFTPKKSILLDKIVSIYTIILVVVVVLIGIIDLSIYKEWGTKINSRAIEFLLLSPGEAIASSTSSPVVFSSIIFIVQIILFVWLYIRYFKFEYDQKLHLFWRFTLLPVFAFIGVMMMRGGLQLAPINQSAAYFSKYTSVNHASLNTEWNLMHSVIENHFSNANPYAFMDTNEATRVVDSLYNAHNNDTSSILKTAKPNIVFVVLESFTSDVVEHFGGEIGVCPNLSKLADEGLSFTNVYASGDRTDKGIIAILSGFPSQAVRTIIQQPDKFEKLPSLPKTLSNNGYSTTFFYGGESEFANFKSYLVSTGIEKIIDKNDFSANQMNSKWGAHDGYLFEKSLYDLKKQKEPFFSVILTLSSHEPFEIPVSTPYTGEDLPSKFRKAAHYTDQCIGEFIENAKKETWYKNTLFVFVADHGHRLPKEYEKAYDVHKFRIPLLFYGEVLKDEYKAKKITSIGSQTDISKTILSQLNIADSTYKWSKNLLDNSTGFAFYSYDNGIGWVDEKEKITMDNVTQSITSREGDSTFEYIRLKRGKAYMQRVFEEYLKY